jgi:hypothetical protein
MEEDGIFYVWPLSLFYERLVQFTAILHFVGYLVHFSPF